MPMPMRALILTVATLLIVLMVPRGPMLAQGSTPPPVQVEISSPSQGSVIGGLVAVIGSAQAPQPSSYSLSFAPSREAAYWISLLDSRTEPLIAGRIALWDTTRIPDGLYVLRLRLTVGRAPESVEYRDYFVDGLLVSNAPRTPTPYPTPVPTYTPTITPTPTATPTAQPTPALEDGESPYLYLTVATQHDPLCPGWQQRFGVWISNVGAITVTNITVTNNVPLDTRPVLSQSTEGATQKQTGQVTWFVPELAPGQGQKLELQLDVPDWTLSGTRLSYHVSVASDQVPSLGKSATFVLGECPWLSATLAALPLPTEVPTETPTATPEPPAGQALARPSLVWPTSTPVEVSIPQEAVDRSLDVLTSVIIGMLALLVIAMIVMLYRRLGPRR
jgi:hypothetical protein